MLLFIRFVLLIACWFFCFWILTILIGFLPFFFFPVTLKLHCGYAEVKFPVINFENGLWVLQDKLQATSSLLEEQTFYMDSDSWRRESSLRPVPEGSPWREYRFHFLFENRLVGWFTARKFAPCHFIHSWQFKYTFLLMLTFLIILFFQLVRGSYWKKDAECKEIARTAEKEEQRLKTEAMFYEAKCSVASTRADNAFQQNELLTKKLEEQSMENDDLKLKMKCMEKELQELKLLLSSMS